MSWITKLVVDALVRAFITYVVNPLIALFKFGMRLKKIEKEAAKSVEPLKNAKTGEEIDKAADPALDGF